MGSEQFEALWRDKVLFRRPLLDLALEGRVAVIQAIELDIEPGELLIHLRPLLKQHVNSLYAKAISTLLTTADLNRNNELKAKIDESARKNDLLAVRDAWRAFFDRIDEEDIQSLHKEVSRQLARAVVRKRVLEIDDPSKPLPTEAKSRSISPRRPPEKKSKLTMIFDQDEGSFLPKFESEDDAFSLTFESEAIADEVVKLLVTSRSLHQNSNNLVTYITKLSAADSKVALEGANVESRLKKIDSMLLEEQCNEFLRQTFVEIALKNSCNQDRVHRLLKRHVSYSKVMDTLHHRNRVNFDKALENFHKTLAISAHSAAETKFFIYDFQPFYYACFGFLTVCKHYISELELHPNMFVHTKSMSFEELDPLQFDKDNDVGEWLRTEGNRLIFLDEEGYNEGLRLLATKDVSPFSGLVQCAMSSFRRLMDHVSVVNDLEMKCDEASKNLFNFRFAEKLKFAWEKIAELIGADIGISISPSSLHEHIVTKIDLEGFSEEEAELIRQELNSNFYSYLCSITKTLRTVTEVMLPRRAFMLNPMDFHCAVLLLEYHKSSNPGFSFTIIDD